MARKNPILDEIHAIREQIAREADNDVDKMIEAARARQAAGGRKAIRLPARKPGAERRAS
jgi:hypothetical protein